MSKRMSVPFESLWQMRIDVPYSLLVRDGDHAWTCGQIALDGQSNVVAADDLVAQSEIVAGYVEEVLGRGGLAAENLKRLMLYYVPDRNSFGGGEVKRMRAAFRPSLVRLPRKVLTSGPS